MKKKTRKIKGWAVIVAGTFFTFWDLKRQATDSVRWLNSKEDAVVRPCEITIL